MKPNVAAATTPNQNSGFLGDQGGSLVSRDGPADAAAAVWSLVTVGAPASAPPYLAAWLGTAHGCCELPMTYAPAPAWKMVSCTYSRPGFVRVTLDCTPTTRRSSLVVPMSTASRNAFS